MALAVAVLTWSRLRFRPSASATVWRRQAALQRRTAGALQPLEQEGYLVLHDVTLPGWPASLDHLLVGATGVWVIESCRRGPLALTRKLLPAVDAAAGPLRGQATAIADALAGLAALPVRPLLCLHGGRWPGGRRPVDGVTVVTPRQLADVVRQAAPLPAGEVDRAASWALQALRPAA
jgi:hypothetical protein